METDVTYASNEVVQEVLKNSCEYTNKECRLQDIQLDQHIEVSSVYVPVNAQWFFSSTPCSYTDNSRSSLQWFSFSQKDSHALEVAWCNKSDACVSVQGGRFDVWPQQRLRKAVYWTEEESVVRRCTWYFRPENQPKTCIPYDEAISDWLESQYRAAVEGIVAWNSELKLSTGEVFIFHNYKILAQYDLCSLRDASSSTGFITTLTKNRVVGRGLDDFSPGFPLDDAEKIDHVIFVVHGIGWRCDLSGHTLVECVNRFRGVTQDMMQSHFSQLVQHGRVELLPVHWYSALHGEDTGLDNHLKSVTLSSVPKLRQYTNDTLVDILFYTSPKFSQRIVDQVGLEMCRLRELFLSRNPNFEGDFSVVGHSLGSVISFDLLAHQGNSPLELAFSTTTTSVDIKSLLVQFNLQDFISTFEAERILDLTTLMLLREADMEKLKLPLGARKRLLAYLDEIRNGQSAFGAGLGQPLVTYPQLGFPVANLFALGSPISLFLSARGVFVLPKEYQLPGCRNFFNIFHPFDPIAYRIESLLIEPENSSIAPCPVLIPHHAGRKRIHLEIKDKLSQVGKEWRNRALSSYHTVMKSLSSLTRTSNDAGDNVQLDAKLKANIINKNVDYAAENENMKMGSLNGGRRVDYVLQETPIESVNDYLFALSSHLCYWKSQDTALFLLCEIYGTHELSSVSTHSLSDK